MHYQTWRQNHRLDLTLNFYKAENDLCFIDSTVSKWFGLSHAGELYARAFLRNGEPHPVEPVIDSSRSSLFLIADDFHFCCAVNVIFCVNTGNMHEVYSFGFADVQVWCSVLASVCHPYNMIYGAHLNELPFFCRYFVLRIEENIGELQCLLIWVLFQTENSVFL